MWIPIRTLYMNELRMSKELTDMGLETFVPMRHDAPDLAPKDERASYPLVPAVHNLLFVRHDYDIDWCNSLRQKIKLPFSFIKRTRNGKDYATVDDLEMKVFMKVCDPMIVGTKFKSPDEISIKAGMMVRVAKGELAGVTGKFVRYQKRHYIAVEISGLCALLSITYKDVELLQ